MLAFLRFLLSTIIFVLTFAAIMASVVLVSMGLLAVPAAAFVLLGMFPNITVVSDLSPPAMLFAGISCLATGLTIVLAVVIVTDKKYRIMESK